MHGKVKLARDLDNGQNVAIKIVPRFSKKRRLGRITQNISPYEKTKREIAILKKIRHPNVVALLEVIDDPDYKKIYLCLEHVECGEVVWRKKGIPSICAFERRRVEREMRGEALTDEEEQYILELERRYNIKEMKRAHLAEKNGSQGDPWSLELGQGADGTEHAIGSPPSDSPAAQASAPNSRGPSRTQSFKSMFGMQSDMPLASTDDDNDGPTAWNPDFVGPTALDGTMYGAYDDMAFRQRSPSVADSIISHMSSLDFSQTHPHDPYADDFSYVPCFTAFEARQAFRDVVLGLQYLHYQGIVHRDIKPANLLWTKEHNVKISDFGVSYFGRPMRESEYDETVSESEAQDFDDELELSKTVGTPAFFAPELCHTDLDVPPPKVTEKIDVWSLGVTLYCMFFARIPFLAEDEFQMFHKISQEEVYIPRRRLRPVDPATSPKTSSLYSRENRAPFRDDHDLVYEDVDENLRDLLFKMLHKDPKKRIDLRGVKHHPWVLGDMPDHMGWLDDTDPARVMQGRKIQLTDKDLHDAVVPLTLLERARSTLKKTLGKLTQSRSTDRSDDASRRRATSSAASSVGDGPAHTPVTPHLRECRRKSLRGDVDYFSPVKEHSHSQSEHPLTYSVTASPDETPVDDAPTSRQSSAVGSYPSRHQALEISTDLYGNEDVTERQTPTPSRFDFPRRHRYSQSISDATLALHHSLVESRTAPSTPAPVEDSFDHSTCLLRKGRDMSASPEDSVRSKSVDRALVFNSQDKRAEPKVSVSMLVAPGAVEQPKRLQQVRSLEACKASAESPIPSPSLFPSHAASPFQYGQHMSAPVLDKFQTVVQIQERPVTAHRVEAVEGTTPPPRTYNTSNAESFARAQDIQRRRYRLEHEEELQRPHGLEPPAEIDAAEVACPPSPDDDDFIDSKAPSREETISTTFSSHSNSGDAIATPWTSPSVVTSPVSYTTSASHKDLLEAMTFQSDPSLPALLSGASSVSADAEGDFLCVPGNPKALDQGNILETSDSLTPPALGKESIAGFPIDDAALEDAGLTTVHINDHRMRRVGKSTSTPPRACDEDEDSDSEDEGLLMMGRRSKKASATMDSPKHLLTRRRNTNASVGSTDTAKKISLPED